MQRTEHKGAHAHTHDWKYNEAEWHGIWVGFPLHKKRRVPPLSIAQYLPISSLFSFHLMSLKQYQKYMHFMAWLRTMMMSVCEHAPVCLVLRPQHMDVCTAVCCVFALKEIGYRRYVAASKANSHWNVFWKIHSSPRRYTTMLSVHLEYGVRIMKNIISL